MIRSIVTVFCFSVNFISTLANTNGSTESYQVFRLPSPRYRVSEVPQWDVRTHSLFYIDIAGLNSTLNRYDYDENRVYQAKVDNAPDLQFILPIECPKNHYLVGIENKAVIAVWDGRSAKATVIKTVFELDPGTSNVINDVKTDCYGRFYGGTKSVESCDTREPGTSGFYTYEPGKGVQQFFRDIKISNGLTWVQQTKKFYYIDSCTYDVKEFNYDSETGNLKNGRVIDSTIESNNDQKPDFILDGMTNDVDGNLYMAAFGGSKILKFDPKTKMVVMEIPLPATQITSLAFGGPKLDVLFVTTANKDGQQSEGSGYVYKITGLCAKGYPGVNVNLCEGNCACSRKSNQCN